MTFALNHMAYFTVTNLLLGKLKPGARIVTVASNAHRGAKLDFNDLQSRKGYIGFPVYARSKLCNILFNRELARASAAGSPPMRCIPALSPPALATIPAG